MAAGNPSAKSLPLHRCLRVYGRARLPNGEAEAKTNPRCNTDAIGACHVAIREMYYEDKTLQRFVAIDSTSKLAYAERHSSGTKPVAARFLRHLIDATPDTIRTGLRDHGIESTRDAHHIDAFRHIFDRVCQAHAIKHGSTKVNQPWTNERVTRMNRTIKDATVNHYHD